MSPSTFTCPGHCGRTVIGRLVACPDCTRRLPRDIAAAVVDSYWDADWPAHARALITALEWFAAEQQAIQGIAYMPNGRRVEVARSAVTRRRTRPRDAGQLGLDDVNLTPGEGC